MSSLPSLHKSFYAGLKEIATAEDAFFIDLIDGLDLARPTFSITKLSDNVSSVKSLDKKRLWEVFYAVGGFVSYLEMGDTAEEIIEDICNYLDKDGVIDFKITDREVLAKRLNQLLNIDKIYFAAKATMLRQEYNSVFIQARIITDIRPIFKLNVEETPTAGIVVHKLHIHYKGDEERGHKDIFFALDSDDITTLKDLLLRAEKKERSLKNIFEKSLMENLSD